MTMILRIVGYAFARWLLGSTAYSTLFHLKRYMLMKGRVHQGEVGEVYATLAKDVKWSGIVWMQLVKLAVAIIIFWLL